MIDKLLKNKNMGNYSKSHSSYWLQDWDDDDIIVDSLSDMELKSRDLYKLSASKRAISNFVNIVTNQQIPVTFNTRGNSYTDGKTVVIGANVIEPSDFDVAVGLALHEGSHIKLSDFNLLRNIYSLVPKHIVESSIKKGINNPIEIIKDIWNYVEDRRIDQFVFNSAPGYRDYYRAMYDKYFNDKMIDKGLTSDEYTEESVESYMFRIINLHNKNTDLTKLKGLREIYRLIGLGNILRLKSSQDTFNVALEVYTTILSNLPTVKTDDQNQQGNGEGSGDEGDSQNGEGNSSNSPREMTDEEFEDFSNGMNGSAPDGGTDGDSNGGSSMSVTNLPDNMGSPSSSSSKSKSETVQLSDKQKELLKKKIQKQKDFMNGEVSKKAVTRKESETLDTMEESGTELQTVGNNILNDYGWGRAPQKGIECVVVKKLTSKLINSEEFPISRVDYLTGTASRLYQTEVAEGIKIGTILGKKLQVRGEDRSTVFNRQKVGKIDKRLVSSLGFGNENVFQYTEIDSYKKANLHISLDASGSMGGDKWRKTIINTVALCKAVDMIQNLTIQVSIRTTSHNSLPYIVMAYDSRTDKFSKAKEVFTCITPGGTTPEGLCFEAIMKNFLPSNNDLDSYFLNVSDGEPYFSGRNYNYYGQPATQHTKRMVKQIEGMGIKTLAYFVTDSYSNSTLENQFKEMYGNGAKMIDVTSVSQITKTMNELFLQK